LAKSFTAVRSAVGPELVNVVSRIPAPATTGAQIINRFNFFIIG
jgi:hypothetical protein